MFVLAFLIAVLIFISALALMILHLTATTHHQHHVDDDNWSGWLYAPYLLWSLFIAYFSCRVARHSDHVVVEFERRIKAEMTAAADYANTMNFQT
jgi:tryptophan-rich sensory protein